tara:strand:- start:25786 stop:26118 length:333 start_codon:yes stop_codon:yes gene_type:complete
MTVKQLMEYVQQHHPHMGEKEIINRVNRFLTSVSKAYDIMDFSWDLDITSGKRIYDLNDSTLVGDTDGDGGASTAAIPHIQDIKEVYIDRVKIPRIEKPVIEDENEPRSF